MLKQLVPLAGDLTEKEERAVMAEIDSLSMQQQQFALPEGGVEGSESPAPAVEVKGDE